MSGKITGNVLVTLPDRSQSLLPASEYIVYLEDRVLKADEGAARVRDLIADGIEAFRLTREYVTPAVTLYATAGWSWFDWTQRAKAELEVTE
jgi:hypothetical protein